MDARAQAQAEPEKKDNDVEQTTADDAGTSQDIGGFAKPPKRRSSGRSSWSRFIMPEQPLKKGASGQSAGKGLTGKFYQLDRRDSFEEDKGSTLRCCQRQVRRVQESCAVDSILGCLILTDLIIGCVEIDRGASGEDSVQELKVVSHVFYSIYVLELASTFFVRGCGAWADKWVLLDAAIVFGGTLDIIVELLGQEIGKVGLIRFLRIFRIVRLLRVLRKFSFLKELHKLVKMTTSCIKTLFWSFVFCFVLMTFWSMVTVALVNPVVQELDKLGVWDDCPMCAQSTTSVMRSNLLFFKTVVVGDEWGSIANPVIEAEPWTAIVFCGAQLTVIFGVLNLVVAVVVDEFADQRQKDVATLAQDLDEEYNEYARKLQKIFEKIDTNADGVLSLEELANGAISNEEFRNRLRVMDIDAQDLEQLFVMLDEDDSGTIDANEFIGALSRWLQDSKTASRFAKYNLLRVLEEQDELKEMMTTKFEQINAHLRDIRYNGLVHSNSKESKGSSDLHPAGSVGIGSWENLDPQPMPEVSTAGNNGGTKHSEAKSLQEVSRKVGEALVQSIHTAERVVQETVLADAVAAAAGVQRSSAALLAALEEVLQKSESSAVVPSKCGSDVNNLLSIPVDLQSLPESAKNSRSSPDDGAGEEEIICRIPVNDHHVGFDRAA